MGELQGYTVNWDAFKKAARKRWVDTKLPGLKKCTIHNTVFKQAGQDDDEPCWQCLSEFEKEE